MNTHVRWKKSDPSVGVNESEGALSIRLLLVIKLFCSKADKGCKHEAFHITISHSGCYNCASCTAQYVHYDVF